MTIGRRLWELLTGSVPKNLERLTYEDLVSCYGGGPPGQSRRVFTEFHRRLRPYVEVAAGDFARRRPDAGLPDALAKMVFETFVSSLGLEPSMVLRRFARHIRERLDDAAFKRIARSYYQQLPLYYLSDEKERRFLDVLNQEGLAASEDSSTKQILAGRLLVSEEEVVRVLKSANQSMKRVLEDEFREDELKQLSEGYLP